MKRVKCIKLIQPFIISKYFEGGRSITVFYVIVHYQCLGSCIKQDAKKIITSICDSYQQNFYFFFISNKNFTSHFSFNCYYQEY